MRVERLTIKDFRGIPDLVLEFAGPVTVLAGVNGSGKTSVLDALAALLRRYGNAIRGGVRDRQPLQARDVRNGVSEAMLAMQVSLPPEHLRLAGDGPGHVGTRVERTLSRVRHHWVAAHAQLVATWLRDCLQEDPATSVPFAVLYRTNRAVLDIPLRIRKKHAFDQFSAYDDALEGGWSSFRLFFEWFREREDLEN